MVEGWEERREAADSVFLFPVVCWLSVMRPRLRPRRPAIGQGIRWLPREAGLSRAASSDPKARNTSVFRNNADTKTETSPAPTCLLCGWLNRKTTKKPSSTLFFIKTSTFLYMQNSKENRCTDTFLWNYNSLRRPVQCVFEDIFPRCQHGSVWVAL